MDTKWIVEPLVTPVQDPHPDCTDQAAVFMFRFARVIGLHDLKDVTVDMGGLIWVEVNTDRVQDTRHEGGKMGLYHRWTSGTGAPGRSHVVFGFTPIRGDFDPIPEDQGRVL